MGQKKAKKSKAKSKKKLRCPKCDKILNAIYRRKKNLDWERIEDQMECRGRKSGAKSGCDQIYEVSSVREGAEINRLTAEIMGFVK